MQSEVVAEARRLEQRDATIAAQLETLAELAGRVESIRRRATEIRNSLERAPGELEDLGRRRAAADDELARAVSELETARGALTRLESSRRPRIDEVERARSEVATAEAGSADARTQVERLSTLTEELHGRHRALAREGDELVGLARAVTSALDQVERIAPGARRSASSSFDELEAWGAQARSALFVARGTLEQERERIVQEANALGSAVLGEPLGASSVSLVRQRLETHAG